MKMRKRTGFVFCVIGFACLMFALILSALYFVGTDARLYHRLQMKADILGEAGISEEDLIRVDRALADCLKGDGDAVLLDAIVFGKIQPAFNGRELAHMEDCRQLFILLKRVLAGCALCGCALLIFGRKLPRSRRKLFRAACIAPLVLLVPLGGFAVWAAVDFTSAFHFFHRLLFTNDLWLLDPETDLLIRICPNSMFMEMGVRIGAYVLLAMAALIGITGLFCKRRKKICK